MKINNLAWMLCLGMLLTGCSDTSNTEDSQTESEEQAAVSTANPYVDCDSLAEAEETAGFEIRVPSSISGYTDISYLAVKDSLIQVMYFRETEDKGETEEEESTEMVQSSGLDPDEILIRKKVSANNSTDYSQYDQTSTITVGTEEITLQGSDDIFYVASWQEDDYSFTILCGEGLDEDHFTAIIRQVG